MTPDEGGTSGSTRRPVTVVAFIVLIVVVSLVRAIAASQPPEGFPEDRPLVIALMNFFRFLFPALLVTAVGVGLWHRLRWVWVTAIVWRLGDILQGAFNIWLNQPGTSYLSGEIGPYQGILPIAAGVLGCVLLLWPSTVRWIRAR